MVGGEETTPNQYPFMVNMMVSIEKQQLNHI
jgi:uncharacterized protein YceH (UPF0502 family)